MDSFPYLNVKIVQWQSRLERTSLNADDREELKAHLDDIIQELSQSGLSEDETWTVAMKRIGSITTIEEEFEKVNPDLGFRRTGTLLIIGAVSMLFFQALFILIPVFYYKQYQAGFKEMNLPGDIRLWPAIFYFLSLVLAGSFLVLIFKGRSLLKYLNTVALKLNTAPAFVAVLLTIISGFYLIQLLNVVGLDPTGFVSPAFKTLTQLFYFIQIILISYFFLVSSKNGVRGLLSFNRKINWKIALFLGASAGVAVTFGFTYHNAYLPVIIAFPLFVCIGWMLSYSSGVWLNLFCVQAYMMLLWASELSGQHSVIFTTYYLITLVFLLFGFISQKLVDFLVLKFKR
ncbi:permease prefix domain 1-containing protein [Pedobacter frigoris]|uniref:permease prefix domain 1-containing protein n=1 Tax=Pedobacter frigoris TaxID=2571272 RepID=UPI00292DE124|nr:permease prefix domain 1-containing protein [Pedobacter frigoris]